MYSLPQEIEVWYIIPAIRRELARCMIAEGGMTYEKVGNILGITKAAVSQYLANKRASKIKLPPQIEPEVAKACVNIAENKSNAVKEIDRLLKIIRKKGYICRVCDTHESGALNNCKEFNIKKDFIDKWDL